MEIDKMLIFCVLVMISEQVLSQSCPTGCTCGNQILNCTGAGLSALPSPLTGYSAIDLSNNNLQSLPTGAFESLQEVTEIILAGNQMSTLSPGAFSDLPALTTLNLKNNRLKIVGQSSFDRLSSLASLQLDGNPIACDGSNDWLKEWESIVSGDCDTSGTIASYLGGITLGDSQISFESATYTVLENDGPASIVVLREGPFSARLDFELTTGALTATSGADFTPMNGDTRTMDPWQTRIVVPIDIIDDADEEVSEAFEMAIGVTSRGEANQATVVFPRVTSITIIDDETLTTVAPTMMPELDPTPEPTKQMLDATTKPAGKPSTSGTNIAAIVVPIVLVIVIVTAICVGYYFYRKRKTEQKVTAGVKYAAVQGQNSTKVYSDTTAKA